MSEKEENKDYKHKITTSINKTSQQEIDVIEQIKEIKLSDFKNIFQIPCTRTGLLYGVGGGLSLGLLHFIITWKRSGVIFNQFLTRKSVMTSCHRAVGGFAFISILSWEKCRYDRKIATQKVQLVAEQFKRMERKKNEAEKGKDENEIQNQADKS